jgi:FdrA protein
MSSTGVRVLPDSYVDSVLQLAGTRAMTAEPGVEWAAAAMGTPANLATLRGEGFEVVAHANDLVLAVRGSDDDVVESALRAADAVMFSVRPVIEQAESVRTLERAVARQPGSNVAIVSVPGDYAALEAHKALSAGLDVLLFSDNVPVEQEIELKSRAAGMGLLVMGPGAGTAVLGGTGLGFANVVEPGRVGVVAAAGTGAQEVMCLLDRWGAGVSAVIGLGGRDLSDTVGGRMARQAIEALRDDPATDVILLVSKPPSRSVADAVLAAAGETPIVAALIGLPQGDASSLATLEAGALATLDRLGLPRPDLVGDLPDQVAGAISRSGEERRLVRGLYSGGTLCYEAQVVLSGLVGPVYSNAPLDKTLGPPFPALASVCLDLGEEEYTAGRPHPMIDPAARIELLRAQATEPAVIAVLLDVVLGYGAHPDPAGALAPVCAEVMSNGGPQVVAYCLGTDADPQGLQGQRRVLRDAGCIVTETAARAALAAGAIALRDPAVITR